MTDWTSKTMSERDEPEVWVPVRSLSRTMRAALRSSVPGWESYPYNMVADVQERRRRPQTDIPYETEGRPVDLDLRYDGCFTASLSCLESTAEHADDEEFRKVYMTSGGPASITRDDIPRIIEWLVKARAWIDLAFENHSVRQAGNTARQFLAWLQDWNFEAQVEDLEPGQRRYATVTVPALCGRWQFDNEKAGMFYDFLVQPKALLAMHIKKPSETP